MAELGIPVPDPSSVKIPLWLRLQTKIAPIDRLLAAREAAEDEEVDDLYKRSTGDPQPEALLRETHPEGRPPRAAAGGPRRPGTAREAATAREGPPHGRRLDLGRDLRRQRRAGGRVRDRRGRLRRNRRFDRSRDGRTRRRDRL